MREIAVSLGALIICAAAILAGSSADLDGFWAKYGENLICKHEQFLMCEIEISG
jgi:hypothetical protein